jgi:hypothetical protein
VRNTDFGVDEFYANDWTVFSPSCSATPAPDQQGKLWYPGAVDDEPYDDPKAPGTGDQTCPEVPPIFDDPPPDDGGIGGGIMAMTAVVVEVVAAVVVVVHVPLGHRRISIPHRSSSRT